MEENSHPESPLKYPQMSKSVSEELKKIEDLERSVTEMQSHLNFLMKRELGHDKKNKNLYEESLKATSSRIKLVETHIKAKEVKQQKMKQKMDQTLRVKEFRQKQNDILRQTRLQVSKLKETQRSEVKELSKRNDEAIRRNKMLQLETNRSKATNIKKEHHEKIQNIKLAKIIEKKEKEERQLKRSIGKISQRSTLEDQMADMRRKQKQLIARIEEKKILESHLKQTVRKISVMDDNQLITQIQKERVRDSSSSPFKQSAVISEHAQSQIQRSSKLKTEIIEPLKKQKGQPQKIQSFLIRDALVLHQVKLNQKNAKTNQKNNVQLFFIR